jgi:hypothetical protein
LPAISTNEAHGAVVEHLNFDAAFVDPAVMEAAEAHEIRWFRFAAMGPVLNVVRIDVTRVGTAGKAAAVVAGFEETA